ncbi:integrase arm-type DNA-binding domain-containing protein [Variovorax sp. J22P168]|uniref:tyrosine-type recombinase/integrase n=1 Tax=Variovorax jilinensis TaxID=3053513 RepID=UPI002576F657|nr:integrase arm-type DNA-binding domain-containing protein [Variovorax sp. J22P168]MDM0010880.1 integrase arm-type DNA-binding domain-containing protein [Variovorax sp. J22P168]
MALTDTFVRQVKPTEKAIGDKYADGGGMYLLVKAPGKYWRMDYSFHGKRKTLALGVYPDVTLAKARQRRDRAREQLADGTDPAIAKREEKQARADAAANTFEAVAREWLAKTSNKRAAVTQAKVTSWLEKDVFPFIGRFAIASIKAKDILDKVARRMEARGIHESAHRTVQICSQVFRYAVATGVAERDVTSDLRGALVAIEKTNYAAITEPKQAGQLMRSIYAYAGHPCAVAGLKLSPLVFVRPGELRAAEWAEIDLDAAEWRIPAAKMKMKVEHLVPLSSQAVDILRAVHSFSGHGRYVFPSIRTGERCMSENTINAALRGMGYSKEVMTAHGFRAMARTIMDEVLGERADLIEHQLAHTVKDPNGRAYNRTAHLPARREMMQRWADYLDKLRVGADVIALNRSA